MKSLTLLAAMIAPFALAETGDSHLSYDWLEAGYKNIQLYDIDADGWGLGFSKKLTRNFYVQGRYHDVTDDHVDAHTQVDITTAELGLGYYHPLTDNMDFTATLSRLDGEEDFTEDEGYHHHHDHDIESTAFTPGLKAHIGKVELHGSARYVKPDHGDSHWGLEVSANYFVSPTWTLSVLYEKVDEEKVLLLGTQYHFGSH
ncbi:hypothetical protein HMF8227_01113 [Saliniradius amylolyticus]|uniref:Outer membrane protein beta-barrel domain-containing protein n=1 Tax=Saliniradius amylolyticus TaxID=2183582 RepID=A0A2S2E1S8_9ALTE|nr:hypothetical protein [Saliniradius amylolyticus]AWL11594.1 hypothetical protein HMF8227_01113 [Saliniradius amylolyticus]